MSTHFEFDVKPTFGDFLRFNFYMLYRRRARWLVWLAIIMTVAFLFAPAFDTDSAGIIAKYKQSLGALILPGIVLILLPLWMYFWARRKFNASRDLHESRTYRFTDQGIEVRGPSLRGVTAWSNMVCAERTGDLILVGNSKKQYYLIPCDAVGNRSSIVRFKRFLRERVPDCKRLA